MNEFILGAVIFYLLSCFVACVLNILDVTDFWSFGEVYFQLPLLPFLLPIVFVKDAVNFFKKYKASLLWYLIKHGVNPFGKTHQLDKLDDTTLGYIVEHTPKNSAIHFYAVELLDRRDDDNE